MSVETFEGERFRLILENGLLPQPEGHADANALRRAGVKLRGTGLLRPVRLPPGWEAVQTDERWGVLRDELGQERARFFYKVQDCRGFTKVNTRYSTWRGRPDNDQWCAIDKATGTVLFEPESLNDSDAYEECVKWLDQHYPAWRDPSHYWQEKKRPWWRFWG